MKKELSRRDLLGRAGLVLGGAMTLGALNGCSSEDDPCPVPEECADTAAALKDFPYEKYLPADFVVDANTTVQQAAYDGYYAGGGCGHGAWSALIADLARAGAPFDQLPATFGQFGGGGIAVYGSICGAALSGVLVLNSVVANTTARAAMMTELLRWYETHEFPQYSPGTVHPLEAAATEAGTDPAEKKLVLNWGSEASKPEPVKVAPGSHLCHASVSGWCAAQTPKVAAGGTVQPDKKARCARVTADVAGKVRDMLNAYLGSGALGARSFTATVPGASVTGCTASGCHTGPVATHNGRSVSAAASGMACTSCHEDVAIVGNAHTTCGTCHQ